MTLALRLIPPGFVGAVFWRALKVAGGFAVLIALASAITGRFVASDDTFIGIVVLSLVAGWSRAYGRFFKFPEGHRNLLIGGLVISVVTNAFVWLLSTLFPSMFASMDWSSWANELAGMALAGVVMLYFFAFFS